jgi:hypothetical protein
MAAQVAAVQFEEIEGAQCHSSSPVADEVEDGEECEQC